MLGRYVDPFPGRIAQEFLAKLNKHDESSKKGVDGLATLRRSVLPTTVSRRGLLDGSGVHLRQAGCLDGSYSPLCKKLVGWIKGSFRVFVHLASVEASARRGEKTNRRRTVPQGCGRFLSPRRADLSTLARFIPIVPARPTPSLPPRPNPPHLPHRAGRNNGWIGLHPPRNGVRPMRFPKPVPSASSSRNCPTRPWSSIKCTARPTASTASQPWSGNIATATPISLPSPGSSITKSQWEHEAQASALVQLALEQLASRHLLETPVERGSPAQRRSRRELLKQLAAAAVALPVILTVTAPQANAAGSQAAAPPSPPFCQGKPDTTPCGGGNQCCVNVCVTSFRTGSLAPKIVSVCLRIVMEIALRPKGDSAPPSACFQAGKEVGSRESFPGTSAVGLIGPDPYAMECIR